MRRRLWRVSASSTATVCSVPVFLFALKTIRCSTSVSQASGSTPHPGQALRRQRRLPDSRVDADVTQELLDQPSVHALVGQVVAGRVPQRVRAKSSQALIGLAQDKTLNPVRV
jgi:hypothetical protein